MRAVHERDRYPTHWPADPEAFAAGDRTLAAWVAELDGAIVGQVCLAALDDAHAFAPWRRATGVGAERLGLIARLFVSPDTRGTGAGGRLLEVAMAELRRRGLSPVLDVATTNPRSAAFYERRGWRRIGDAELALSDPPGESLAMWLYVGPPGVDVVAVEAAASRALPALEIVEADGWLLRATPGVAARRANSVLARGGPEDDGSRLDARIQAVREFYARRGRSARFQLTPVSRPDGLEDELRRRGFARESPTLVMSGDTGNVGDTGAAAWHVEIAPVPDPTWLATWCEARGADPTRADGPRALWERIEPERAYATASDDGGPAGAGMAVRDGNLVGIFNMATRPERRRRGVASAVLAALGAWGRAGGASTAYLQVDVANGGARALYAAAGLRDAYEYVYLRRD